MNKYTNININKLDAKKALTETELHILETLTAKVKKYALDKEVENFIKKHEELHTAYTFAEKLGIDKEMVQIPSLQKSLLEAAREQEEKNKFNITEDYKINQMLSHIPGVQVIEINELIPEDIFGLPNKKLSTQDIIKEEMIKQSIDEAEAKKQYDKVFEEMVGRNPLLSFLLGNDEKSE